MFRGRLYETDVSLMIGGHTLHQANELSELSEL